MIPRMSTRRAVQLGPGAKGRLGKPVEFGYKGQIVDNDDGILWRHAAMVEAGLSETGGRCRRTPRSASGTSLIWSRPRSPARLRAPN